MRFAALILALPTSAFVLPACNQEAALRRQEVEEIARAHELELAAQQRAQDDFATAHGIPRELEFPGHGTLEVVECELQGRLGREEVRLRFVWTNTTGRTAESVRVTLSLLDTQRRVRRSEEALLDLPLNYRFVAGASYTATLLAPTQGLHLEPGWTIDIGVQAAFPAEREQG